MMRVLGAILTGLTLFAGTIAAAPPPSGGGAARPAYTTATCYPGFSANPGNYPASAQNVKFQCFATASCPPLFTSVGYSKTPPKALMFEYGCSRDGSVLPAGKATCSAGFTPTIQGYPAGEKLVYYCDTKVVNCPTGFDVVDNDADSGVSAGAPPKFFYACISSGPH